MRPVGWKSAFIFLSWTLFWLLPGWADQIHAGEIYDEVFSIQEEYQLKKGDRLPSIAQSRAMRLQILAKQANVKNPNSLKPGTTLNINNSFILPKEVTDGLVVNLAELAVYHFQNGVFFAPLPLSRRPERLGNTHRKL
jgi:hypothetical protein